LIQESKANFGCVIINGKVCQHYHPQKRTPMPGRKYFLFSQGLTAGAQSSNPAFAGMARRAIEKRWPVSTHRTGEARMDAAGALEILVRA
jgi:hypothetical protein